MFLLWLTMLGRLPASLRAAWRCSVFPCSASGKSPKTPLGCVSIPRSKGPPVPSFSEQYPDCFEEAETWLLKTPPGEAALRGTAFQDKF